MSQEQSSQQNDQDTLVKYTVSCHCGGVVGTFNGPSVLDVLDCNCSICTKKGFLHYIVSKSNFDLKESSQEHLSCYTFGTHTAKHFFSKTCGISPFYIPRSNPDGYDINVRCLDNFYNIKMKIEVFDGQNWEQNASELAHLSKEE